MRRVFFGCFILMSLVAAPQLAPCQQPTPPTSGAIVANDEAIAQARAWMDEAEGKRFDALFFSPDILSAEQSAELNGLLKTGGERGAKHNDLVANGPDDAATREQLKNNNALLQKNQEAVERVRAELQRRRNRPKSLEEEIADLSYKVARSQVERYKANAAASNDSPVVVALAHVGANKGSARSAVQATQLSSEAMVDLLAFQSIQNQRLIEQNDLLAKQNAEMIALLKQLAAKK